jgi:hypothetical protein
MYWDVIKVQPVAPRELAVQFADGLTGVLHIDTSFCTGVFKELLNDRAICGATVSNGVLTWPNGLDLAPDTMYHEIKRSPDGRYNLRR